MLTGPAPFLLSLAVTMYLTCFASAALHELAHALAATLLGIPVHSVTIGRGPRWLTTSRLTLRGYPMGGQIALCDPPVGATAQLTPRKLGVIAMAGPWANAVTSTLAALASAHLPVSSLGWCALAFATLFNVLCFFQNGLAVPGTDGYLFWQGLFPRALEEGWLLRTINQGGHALFHVVIGGYMGWLVWQSGVLLPWLAA